MLDPGLTLTCAMTHSKVSTMWRILSVRRRLMRAFIIVCRAGGLHICLLQLIRPHMPDGSCRARPVDALVWPEQEPDLIHTLNGRPTGAGRSGVAIRLMPCLILCLALLSGCERNQQPGPGPKPMSGSGATNAAPAAAAGASGTQATPR